jgi:hypothetical protein
MGTAYSARQSSFSDGDTIDASDSNNEFDAILSAFGTSGHSHDGTAGEGGAIAALLADAITIGGGNDTDIVLTFNANSNDGVLSWMEDEDQFRFSDDVQIIDDKKLIFGTDENITIEYDEDGIDTLLIAGGDVTIADDKKLYFGTGKDVSIEYDEDGIDTLLIGGGDVTIADDKKLYFGTGKDVSIEYDEDGIDTLLIAGGDVTIADDKKLYFGTGKDVSLEYDEDGIDALLISGGDVTIADDKKLYFGTGKDISLEYDEDGTDKFILTGNTTFGDGAYNFDIASHDGTNGLALAGTVVTSTAAELNLLDGDTSVGGSITIVNGDGVIMNDGGTMKSVPASAMKTYVTSATAADDIAAGDAAVNFTTSTGNITVDAQGDDTDIIFKGTDGGVDTTFLTLDGSAAGAASFNGVVTANAGVVVDNITIDGTEIDLSSGDLTLDVAGDILLDAAGEEVIFKDGSTNVGHVSMASDNLTVKSLVSDKDVVFQGNDGGSPVTALTLDMSAAGDATFNSNIQIKDTGTIGSATTAGAISIAANGLVNLATAAATVNSAKIKTVGTETIWVPAQAMRPAATNPCADITSVDSGGNSGPDLQVLDFDKDSDEHAQFSVAMPKSWDGGNIQFQAYWIGIAATTGVAWALQVKALNDNEDINVAYGTAVVVQDDSQGSASELMVSATSGDIACSGATNDLLFCQILRDVSDGNDDMSGDARLVGIKIYYQSNAATDT